MGLTGDGVTFDVFRGSEGKIGADRVTKSLVSNKIFIETTHSGVCGTDLHFMDKGKVLGHEGVGVVQQLGPGVTSVNVSDREMCGTCKHCLASHTVFGRLVISARFVIVGAGATVHEIIRHGE